MSGTQARKDNVKLVNLLVQTHQYAATDGVPLPAEAEEGRAVSRGAGSLDNIQDALDCLEREGCVYILAIGRIGENVTNIWSMNRGNTDEQSRETMRAAISEHLDKRWSDEDTP